MEKKIFDIENKYLKNTLSLVDDKINQLENNSASVENNFSQSNDEYMEYLRDNANKFNDDDFVEIINLQGKLNEIESYSIDLEKELKAYNKMKLKPYFASIDIQDEELTDIEKYYIGLHSLTNEKKEYVVIDWRSPIASIFYDYEIGKCELHTNSSILRCNLLSKRQFGIESGELKYYIDTTINIEDSILQEALARNTTNQMKSIVQTIQKEQNAIIRGDENKNLIVQGVAGSGKTAIALHRIAYLLYKLRNRIKSEDIIFITPNSAFGSYISTVLPDLAEDDIPKNQLDSIARVYLKKHLILEKKYEQMERLINSQDLTEYNYKTSYGFLSELLAYAKTNYIDNYHIEDFDVNGVNIDSNKILELFYGKYSDRDLFTRFKWITDNIYDLYFYKIKSVDKILKYKQFIFNKLYSAVDNKNCVKAYMKFLDSKKMKLELVGNKVKNEDAYAILFFRLFIYGLDKFDNVKHLVIDEMQDYSAVQLYILNYLFDCPKTMLGDFNQTINPDKTINNIDNLQNILHGESTRVDLIKTYRSTEEIVEFYNKVGKKTNVNYVNRHGEPIEYISMTNDTQVDTINKLLSDLVAKNYNSIAIITKSNKIATQLHSMLKNENISLIDDNTDSYDNKICIISIYNSKGLEFDAVILYNINDDYKSELDRNLLYIASTRALHELKLTYIGGISPLVEKEK